MISHQGLVRSIVVCFSVYLLLFPIAQASDIPSSLPAQGTTGGSKPQLPTFRKSPSQLADENLLQDKQKKAHVKGKAKQQVIKVSALRIQGVVEHPKQGITKKKIQALASQVLGKKLAEKNKA